MAPQFRVKHSTTESLHSPNPWKEENDQRNNFVISIELGRDSNSRILDQLLDSLPIVLQGILSQSQTVWIQIRTNIVSVLIWVQNVSKGYPQTTKLLLDSKE